MTDADSHSKPGVALFQSREIRRILHNDEWWFVITDVVAAQDAMREHAKRATMAVMIATALHSIAVGNMLPSYYDDPERGIVERPTICVDASEFLVSKLKERGTHQAVGVVTNAQDFMSILRREVEREVRES